MTVAAAGAFIDSHAHLDDEQFSGDVAEVIAAAHDTGVGRIVNIGYRPGRWESTIALAARFPTVSYSVGLHPHHADQWSEETEHGLLRLFEDHHPVAVGEIGLDFFRNRTPPDVQRVVFKRQLEIASAAGLPVVIHMRAAEEAVLDVLEQTPSDLRCVLHSFDGTQHLANFAVDRGYFLGVGGLMTRPTSISLREVLSDVPLARLLLETDSPYLAPAGVAGRRNEPRNIPVIAHRLAELKEISLNDVAKVTTAAAVALFDLESDAGRRRGAMR